MVELARKSGGANRKKHDLVDERLIFFTIRLYIFSFTNFLKRWGWWAHDFYIYAPVLLGQVGRGFDALKGDQHQRRCCQDVMALIA